MRKALGSLVLFIFGWKAIYPTQYKFPKLLMLAAPHTSNWDLIFTFASYWKLGLYPNFMIYDKVTKGLFGYFFKKAGAMGVPINKKHSMVDYIVSLYNNQNNISLVITLNYKTKVAAINLLSMSGNFEKDMLYIQSFYEKSVPKYPENYNKKIF